MDNAWTTEDLHTLSRHYQTAAILHAAAELDLFSALSAGPSTAARLAKLTACDLRGLTVLLDALAAINLLRKAQDRYSLAPGVDASLVGNRPGNILAITRHHANCARNWTQLAQVIKTGNPADRTPSICGSAADQASFIEGMDNLSAPVADRVIQAIQPLQFKHLLDIGGASGTWSIAFLRACPTAFATIVDLPQVITRCQQRIAQSGLDQRARLVAADFMTDDLPAGADLAWVSAVVHQNSRPQNRKLFAKLFGALQPGGRLAIRDILMDESRIRPVAGALFAVNMLVATEGGGTFTPGELREDLASAGFTGFTVARNDEGMHAVVVVQRTGAS